MAHTMTHPHFGRSYKYNDHAEQTPVRRARDRLAVEREQFGGFHFGAAFFGWLVSTGMAAILTAILAAAGGAVAFTVLRDSTATLNSNAATVGLVSGIALVILLAIAYYAGGYVAGRMARFHGTRQGFGVWLVGLLVAMILASAGAVLGVKYNVLQQLNLPHIPVKQGTLTTGGLLTSLAALATTLLAALAGGAKGERYHRRIDTAGIDFEQRTLTTVEDLAE